ncbi:hypothetical protein N7453_006310 [Penicillium expansum]|nr:hypothetical protein N7453_006310 [Penicillium expansum]
MSLCQNRLQEERKQWRRDHPFGFVAKPKRAPQGGLDLKNWECAIPGKANTLWEGGLFKIDLIFPDEYPTKPPKYLLDDPNPESPAQAEAYNLFKKDRPQYERRVRMVVKENQPN